MANIYKRSQINLYHNYEDQGVPMENKFSLSQGLSSCSMDVPTEWHVSTNALKITSGQDVVDNVATSILGNAAAVSAETTRAQAAELTLTTDLAAETTRAQAAELTLTTNLATETSRIDSILALSAADLNSFKEIVDAYNSADSNLQTLITTLTTRFDALEQVVNTLAT